MVHGIRFDPCALPPEAEAVRAEVRAFLAAELGHRTPAERARSWSEGDPAFSRKVGARGWIGMTWPKAYGGGEHSPLVRYAMIEEMLAAGAPVAAHWTADRQSGPLLLRFGSEDQRRRFLPPITRGELFFCIGMSEPDAGSDLAAVRTRAVRADGGWRLNGTKLWTSKAHQSHYMIALVRSSGEAGDRHAGLSQFIVDLGAPGLSIRPIPNLAGERQFNEVVFEDVFVPGDMLIGAEGAGWSQVMTELSFERCGPERYMSSHQLLLELIREAGPEPSEREAIALGRLTARLLSLRHMSKAVAGAQAAGHDPALEGSIVKAAGSLLEQDLPRIAQDIADIEPGIEQGSDLARVLAYVTQVSPSFSLRGGTREILRGIVARGLGLR